MIKTGDRIRWQSPLDEDYSYGIVLEVNKNSATVRGSGYYAGTLIDVHLRNIEKLETGGNSVGSGSKRNSKYAIT